jgi:hypothetical protein
MRIPKPRYKADLIQESVAVDFFENYLKPLIEA